MVENKEAKPLPIKFQTTISTVPVEGLAMYTSKEYSSQNLSWNYILFISYDPYKTCTRCSASILCRPANNLKGQLRVQIKVSDLSTKDLNCGWKTFNIPFNQHSKGAIMSNRQTLSSFLSYFDKPTMSRLTVDISWECNFSIVTAGTNPAEPTPTDPEYVIKKLENLQSTQRLTDMVFVVGDEELPAHRLILSAMSEVFSNMFFWETSEKKTGRVEVKDATAAGIKQMLRCIYTSWEPEWTGISVEDLLELAYLAHKYELEPLLAHCKRRMIETLQLENVCQMLKAASTLSLQSVMDRIGTIIKDNKSVLQSKEWKILEEDHPRIANEVYRIVIGL